jgi:hypothetical protein
MSKPNKEESVSPPICGIIMPMSAADTLSKAHWEDVHAILRAALASVGFEARIVSTADEVSIIQKRIVSNLYADPIVVCDVSAGKPNVLFELGLRIAFDKPVVIIKDDKTPYNFDTAPVEHLEYPRDLRHGQIEVFKSELAKRVRATFEASQKDGYKSFLQSFGPFSVAKLDQKEVGPADYRLDQIFEQIRFIQGQLSRSLHLSVRPPELVRDFGTASLQGKTLQLTYQPSGGEKFQFTSGTEALYEGTETAIYTYDTTSGRLQIVRTGGQTYDMIIGSSAGVTTVTYKEVNGTPTQCASSYTLR